MRATMKFSWFPFFFLGFQVFLEDTQTNTNEEAVGKKKEKKARENKKADEMR
tara:strand:+ start:139 stop:294 length:156 start_codon:yes stop_codon:yes gene_type:complete